MLKYALLLGTAALITPALGTQAWACTCSQQVLDRGTLDSTDAVFSGTVMAKDNNDSQDVWTVTLKVERIWKGMLGNEVRVTTPMGGGACGYHFEVGRKYLVYAYRHRGTTLLHTHLCTHTKPLSEADADRKLFGEGYSPADVQRIARQIDSSSGLYQVGHPIPLRMTYRGGIEGWEGRIRVEDGWAQPTGGAFLRIEQVRRVQDALAQQAQMKQPAKEEPATAQRDSEKPEFDVVADMSRSHHLETPGKYLVTWGCRLSSGFEVSRTSEIEILDLLPDGTWQVPRAREYQQNEPRPGRARTRPPRTPSAK